MFADTNVYYTVLNKDKNLDKTESAYHSHIFLQTVIHIMLILLRLHWRQEASHLMLSGTYFC